MGTLRTYNLRACINASLTLEPHARRQADREIEPVCMETLAQLKQMLKVVTIFLVLKTARSYMSTRKLKSVFIISFYLGCPLRHPSASRLPRSLPTSSSTTAAAAEGFTVSNLPDDQISDPAPRGKCTSCLPGQLIRLQGEKSPPSANLWNEGAKVMVENADVRRSR